MPSWDSDIERRRSSATERKAELRRRYGSLPAVFEPCGRERLILQSVASWRVSAPHPFERRTESLVSDDDGRPAFCVVDAVRNAYPLPRTLPEAEAELYYWKEREREFADLLFTCMSIMSKPGLDLAVKLRMKLLGDEVERLRADRDPTVTPTAGPAIARRERRRTGKGSEAPQTPAERAERIARLLTVDPACSDRHAARTLGCSPTTVGKVRRTLGLYLRERSVHRGVQAYRMMLAASRDGPFEEDCPVFDRPHPGAVSHSVRIRTRCTRASAGDLVASYPNTSEREN